MVIVTRKDRRGTQAAIACAKARVEKAFGDLAMYIDDVAAAPALQEMRDALDRLDLYIGSGAWEALDPEERRAMIEAAFVTD